MTWQDFARACEALPTNSIAPENRGIARVSVSYWVPRGTIVRVNMATHGPQEIVFYLHPTDHARVMSEYPSLTEWHLADCLEEVAATLDLRQTQ